MAKYGLIGKTLKHSFSEEYFRNKFEEEQRHDTYENFEIESPTLLKNFLEERRLDSKGLNVTAPYKEVIMPLLDRIDNEAKEIGAVNTIKVTATHKLIGYNSDDYGFAQTLSDYLPIKGRTALILGTGGASKAIAFVLKTMGFDYKFVSRNGKGDVFTYQDINTLVMANHYLIVNCTPLGSAPDIQACPNIPYKDITSDHVLIDLIYNPSQTEFLKRGFANGARVSNGLKMLRNQADKSWSIWQK